MLDWKLEAYKESGVYPFHMPGHKQHDMGLPNPYSIDITEIDGFDDLHHANGILKEAQERAATLYGSDCCYDLVNGSTCGVLAAVCAATKRGSKVLMARNCHKSVYHAVVLQELAPVYLYPEGTRTGICGSISPDSVRRGLEENPDAAAVILTSPTYDGVVSDIRKIADLVHLHSIPLIVDEAHGAHFGFHPGFPQNAVKQGADAVIMSLHKTLPSFTQTALLHLCSNRISRERVGRYLDIFETSSPSYVLMAGMEACIRLLQTQADEFFSRLDCNLREFYARTSGLAHIRVITAEQLKKEGVYDFDSSRLLLFPNPGVLTGKELADCLLRDYKIQLEMASGNYALALSSIMDTKEGFLRLAKALIEMDSMIMNHTGIPDGAHGTDGPDGQDITKVSGQKMETVLSVAEAVNCPGVWEDLETAEGMVSAGFVSVYPPGIPFLVPGERIRREQLCLLRTCIRDRLEVHGVVYVENRAKIYIVNSV